MTRKDSWWLTAEVVAEKRPWLSQVRYLPPICKPLLHDSENSQDNPRKGY